MKNYYKTAAYLQEFVKTEFKRSDIFPSELVCIFISKMEHFLRKHKPKDHQKPLLNNGAVKHLERKLVV